jgi:hypothetical protein
MAYFVIEDFRSGLDLRRPGIVAPAGTLSKLVNAHLTAGGDIEKRYAFVKAASVDPGTIGLAGIGSSLYVFQQGGAREAPKPVTLQSRAQPVTVSTIMVPMPAGTTAERLMDWELYNGIIYYVIRDTAGNFHHFYGETYVADVAKVHNPAPHHVKVFNNKIYGITQDKICFSALDNPLVWDPENPDTTAIGQGFILASNQNGAADFLVGLEIYYDQLAVATRYATQIWEVDADPDNNNLRQTLRSAGTVAPNSMLQYGSGDVLYLHDSGIRSLRAKDSSNAAAVSDIGSPIDPEMQSIIKSRPDDTYITRCFSLVEPNTGRFWMCFNNRIFVLSYYPGPKVTAWSEYIPEFPVDYGVVAQSQVVFRSGDDLYVYGGVDGITYDGCEVSVEVPPLAAGKPATMKMFTGIDLAAWGEWSVYAGFDPNVPSAKDPVAINLQPTVGLLGAVALQGASTHISLTLSNKAEGSALLSSIVIHYQTNGKAD